MTAVEAKEKYLELAKIEELQEMLTRDGYSVEREVFVEGYAVDLMARKGGESIFYEVVAQHRIRTRREDLLAIRQIARDRDCEFRLVVVHSPRQSVVEIEDLASVLRSYLSENEARYFDTLGHHVVVEDVHSVSLTDTRVSASQIDVCGFATVDATIQAGDDEVSFFISAPFTFKASLAHDLTLQEDATIEVDLSDWYE